MDGCGQLDLNPPPNDYFAEGVHSCSRSTFKWVLLKYDSDTVSSRLADYFKTEMIWKQEWKAGFPVNKKQILTILRFSEIHKTVMCIHVCLSTTAVQIFEVGLSQQ